MEALMRENKELDTMRLQATIREEVPSEITEWDTDKKRDDLNKWKRLSDKWYEVWKIGRAKKWNGLTSNKVTTYNAAHMSLSRAKKIAIHMRNRMVLIQSTGRENEDKVFLEELGTHNCYQFPQLNKTNCKEQINTGCAILIPPVKVSLIESIGVPNCPTLIGRAGYVRIVLKRKFDFTYITAYFPVENTDRETTNKLWYWIEEVINTYNAYY